MPPAHGAPEPGHPSAQSPSPLLDPASTSAAPPPEPDRRHLPLDVSGLPVVPVRAPQGAPNVLLVVVDDMGFGASSPYGGPVHMPTAERLAAGGLRYSRFHVTSLCSPTRQALLTGRNHHSVGMGVTSEMATSEPGYHGFRPRSAGTLAQVLAGNGYSTAAFGKWHQTPPVEVTPSGPFTRWPTGEGFGTFYGFLGAEMNHWYPQLYAGTSPYEPERTPQEGYHLTEDLLDQAVTWVRTQTTLTPDRPFFCYLALGATHAPFHVAPEWIERYRGRFDAGWDAMREEILARQQQLGVVPEGTSLAPWADGVPHWDELDDAGRRVAVRLMETYAGFAEHADRQVGRLVDALEEAGALENTLVLYLLGDNGASGEGGLEGTVREHLVGHGIADDVADMDARLDEIGSPSTYGMYPVGWALAMNTPYQWTKQVASHFGGTRDGLVVHWPAGFAARGEVRDQFHHVIDILPTVCEAAGVPLPETVEGVLQQPVEGVSMGYSFDAPAAADRRRTQYFEMVGNRGIYHEGWTAVARHGRPWRMTEAPRPFEDDPWELYDTTADWSQSRDLAGSDPQRLAALREVFVEEAARHHVFPLDDRVTERENPELAGRFDLHHGRRRMVFGPTTRRLSEEAAPNVKNRSHRVSVELDLPHSHLPPQASGGVLVAQGGRFGGWSFYLLDGRPCYAYNRYGRDLTVVRSRTVVRPGAHTLAMDFVYDGGPPGSGARVSLLVDGTVVGEGRLAATTAYYFAFDETFNVGVDRGSPVVDDYPPLRNAFTGRIDKVVVDLEPGAPLAPEERAALAARLAD
ncbi:sulfatase-like hydrolase/transferase [Phycicoccus endophyticus]|nr:sulfatase-like hydrolase/transferase [Phycicoccus endophyticus]GGL28580.1 arylsulfatase [Phycicoccus endophyticus]